MDDKLITIKQYAEDHDLSYEAVRKQIARFEKSELKGHVRKQNRKKYLDAFAVNFLDNHRFKSAVSVTYSQRTDELNQLREENTNLLKQIANLQQQIIQEKETNSQLQQKIVLMLESKQENTQVEKGGFFSRIFKRNDA